MSEHLYQRIDLHTHSTASDGKLTPSELVLLAKEKGVTMLALTDHDTLAGLDEARQVAEREGVQLINGCELSVAWNKIPLHMVALGFDQGDPALLRWTHRNQVVRLDRGRQIADLLVKKGLPDLFNKAIEEAGESQLGRPHFAKVMVREGMVKDMNKAFDQFLSNKKIGQIRDVWPQLEEILPELKSSGCELILAHPKRYPITVTKLKAVMADFKRHGGTAIEVASGNERPDHVRFLERLSREFEFKASVGSDFHGAFGPWTNVGHYTQIHEQEIAPVWYSWQQ
ncbi:PHP domain-containing protein [Marinomonas piezotolerans]|uniref:PHP domain-containing protein n=1 Tax=Marinomonas piezotolerans TaxID=2213058 RepID=A0A370U774_9GAMM|nr:PHP domain-containing protein [Marinomonas piezotolerans]RDL43612.1 PHP domain-containing protein [Marinomonas piezotolerans]